MKYLCLTMLFFCVSCAETQKNSDLITLKVDCSEIAPDFDYSGFVEDSIHVVCLEADEGKLIGEISNLQIVGDTIYIIDEISQSIFRYDMDGKFISKLSGKGRAHNEYVELIGNCLFVNDMNLHVIDKFGGKIIVYDKNNQFVRSVPTKTENGDQLFFDFIVPEDDGYHAIRSKGDDFHYFNIGNDDVIKSKDIAIAEFKKSKNWRYGPAKDLIYFSHGDAYVGFFGTDTIYNISNGMISSKYVVDFGVDKVSESLLSTEANLFKVLEDKIVGIQGMAFLGKYILLFYKHNKKFLVSMYSSDGELIAGPCVKFVYKDIIDFVDINSSYYTNDYSISIIPPTFIKRFSNRYRKQILKYKNGENYIDYFDRMANEYDIDCGNAMLIIHKWKK